MHDRRQQLKKARSVNRAQRKAKNSLVSTKNSKWVNPRTLHVLSEMGFDKDLCALALQKTDNDINRSVMIYSQKKRFNRNSKINKFILDCIAARKSINVV